MKKKRATGIARY